jgi:hypothetical protein
VEEEEEDLFIFNDTIEGPIKPGRIIQARWGSVQGRQGERAGERGAEERERERERETEGRGRGRGGACTVESWLVHDFFYQFFLMIFLICYLR